MCELTEYAKVHSFKECAKKFECHVNTIRRRLRRLGIITKDHHLIINKVKLLIDKNQFIEYFKDHNLLECATKYNCGTNKIRRILRGYGIDTSDVKINLDKDKLINYFKDHTLSQCANEFKCSCATVKRILNGYGIDTSIHNNSELAKQEFRKTVKDTSMLTKEFIYDQYIVQNKDSKLIAGESGFHYNTIRDRIRGFGLKKSPKAVSQSMMCKHFEKTGYMHPGQRPDVIEKINKGKSRFQYISTKTGRKYLFKSLHELCFALLLDDNINVNNWDYELISVQYIDRLTGKIRLYYIDFSVQYINGMSRWIEIKPSKVMIPSDKRLYAAQEAKKANIIYSGITDIDRTNGYNMFLNGFNYDNINFKNNKILKKCRCYTYWFKYKKEIEEIENDHFRYISEHGKYFKCKFVAKAKNKINTI